MELLQAGTGLAEFYARAAQEDFTLIDIGCGGGLDRYWRLLEPMLRAFGFDPNLAECKRLREAEPNPSIEYVAAFVAYPGSACSATDNNSAFVGRNPWNRLAISKTQKIRATKRLQLTEEDIYQENLWREAQLADLSAAIDLGDFFRARKIEDVDFIKIDVDGADFKILQSIEAEIARTNVLGVCLEVNWIGSADSSEHSFHNTDRFMRSVGFDLFGLTTRRYAMAALPTRYRTNIPAESVLGRPLQGDAVYLRDLAADYNQTLGEGLSRDKILKLAVLFDLFGLPDHVADLVLAYEHKLGGRRAVTDLLDHLMATTGVRPGGAVTYAQYMQCFEDDDPAFYAQTAEPAGGFEPPAVQAGRADTFRQRLRAAQAILARLRRR